jgi:SAM-dependent methyltransferase
MLALGRLLTRVFRDRAISVKRYGPIYVAAYLFDVIRIHRAAQTERFDADCGTETATLAYPWNLPSIRNEDTPDIHAYEAVPAWLVREAIASIPLQPYVFTFVDLGSGKGRALLAASEFPFAKIVGVEISRELHRTAQENVVRYRSETQQCTAFSLHCVNAKEYAFGPEPLVLFLSNPFGKNTMRSVLANLEVSLRANPREAYVVYVNPRFRRLAQRAHLLRPVKKGGRWWRPWSRYVVYVASPGKRQ